MKNDYKKYRMIEATAIPATNHLPCRVKICERARFNAHNQKSKMFSFDYNFNNTLDLAEHLLIEAGFNIICIADHKDAYVFLCDNWGDKFIEIKDI